MEYINKKDISIAALSGRGLQRAIGKDSYFNSTNMTVGYALYSEEYGTMDPHHHAEETVIVTKTKDGYVSWGETTDTMNQSIKLEEGMILHIPENEWHVFKYKENGFVEIIFIYGGTDNVRPEEK